MVKSGDRRIKKYAAKIDGDHIGKAYERVKDISVASEKEYFAKAVELQNKTKTIISSEPVILHHFYMCYSEMLEANPTNQEREITYHTWLQRGLLESKLKEIALSLFGWAPYVAPAIPQLYEFYNVGANNNWELYGARWMAQTITIGNTGPNENHNITSIKLELLRIGSPGDLTISIQALDGADKPDGVDLSTGTTDGNTLNDGGPYIWREIDMSAFTMQASTKYAIVIRALTGDVVNSVWWRAIFSSPTYLGGVAAWSNNSGVDWTLRADWDNMFEEWGTKV